MGFGHRVYRVRDPRADAVKSALQVLVRSRHVDLERLRLAEGVERTALEALGFPREAFTCVFTTSRSGGWIAHARDQVLKGRLIRPQSRYVGARLADTRPSCRSSRVTTGTATAARVGPSQGSCRSLPRR
jgi:citrate synthase